MSGAEHDFLGQVLVGLVAAFLIVLPLAWWFRRRWRADGAGIPPRLPEGAWWKTFPNLVDLAGVGFFVMLFALMWLGAKQSEAPELGRGLIAVNAAAFLMLAALVPALVFWRVRLDEFFGLRWRHWPWIGVIAPGFVAGMVVVMGGLLFVTGWKDWVEARFQGDQQAVVELLQGTDDMVLLGLLAISAVVIAPLAEEVIFRGYIFRVLREWCGLWPAALFSGMLFGVIHFNVLGLPVLAAFGVVLALIYDRTRCIWVPIACHAAFNGFQVGLALLAKFGALELPS